MLAVDCSMMMKLTSIMIAVSVALIACASPPRPDQPTAAPSTQMLEELIRRGRFDEAKRIIEQRRKTDDPLVYWAHWLTDADKMWGRGKREECLREYEEFFRFYEEWQTKTQDHGSGQPDGGTLRR